MIFIAAVMLLVLEVDRRIVALFILLFLSVTELISPGDILGLVDWDVLGLVVCMGVYSAILEVSGFAKWTAWGVVRRVKSPRLLVYMLILIAGLVSLVLENTVTVFIFAPVALAASSLLGLDVRKLLVGIALASGMSGSATMIGDPPAIIIAGHYNLAFTDYIIFGSKPSMFFITLIPMLIAIGAHVLYNFRGFHSKYAGTSKLDVNTVDRKFVLEALVFLLLKITLLSLRRELRIPLTLPALLALLGVYTVRITLHGDYESVKKTLKEGLDYKLPLFLVSIFLLSGVLKKYGVTDIIAEYMLRNIGANIVVLGLVIFTVSALLSSLIENIPVTLTLIPVVDTISSRTGLNPIVLVWGILSGLTAGGGYTYIGSGANVVAVHILDNKGFKISFTGFVKTALAFNVVNTILVLLLYAVIWLLGWHLEIPILR
jgi:Na+/H+ antiporter NhaD/arsenite permease-like protein